MPTPTLIRNQNGLTEEILSMAKLDFVIRMPYNLFSEQGRTVNTSVFGFTKTPHNENDSVLFYNLEDDGFVSIQHKGRIDKDNKWKDIENQIIDSVFNLNEISHTAERKKIYKNGILNCSGYQNRIKSGTQFVTVSDLFDINNGTLQSSKSEEGEYDFITGAEDWKTHAEYELEEVSKSDENGSLLYGINLKILTSLFLMCNLG